MTDLGSSTTSPLRFIPARMMQSAREGEGFGAGRVVERGKGLFAGCGEDRDEVDARLFGAQTSRELGWYLARQRTMKLSNASDTLGKSFSYGDGIGALEVGEDHLNFIGDRLKVSWGVMREAGGAP